MANFNIQGSNIQNVAETVNIEGGQSMTVNAGADLDLNALFKALIEGVPEAEAEIKALETEMKAEKPNEASAKNAIEKLAPHGSKIGQIFGKLGLATVKGLIKELPFGSLVLEIADALKE